MFLVWEHGVGGRPNAYKCETIPTNGHGKAMPYLASHPLSAIEFGYALSLLERLYPPPSTGDSS